MDDLQARAARAGIATEYQDAWGGHRTAKPEILSRVLEILERPGEAPPRVSSPLLAMRQGHALTVTLDVPSGCSIRWEIRAEAKTVGGVSAEMHLAGDLPVGTWDVAFAIDTPQGTSEETARLIVAPEHAFQGDETAPPRTWALAVQLYGVRSHRNWGHGDFGDLARLVDLAAKLGASGLGLNPLHALFDDRAEEASPYSPNSRFFLNTLYIDVEAVPEFSGAADTELADEVAALRQEAIVPYARVAAAKRKALQQAHQAFRAGAKPARRRAYAAFRQEGGTRLERFAAFEVLRRRFEGPWWEWPEPWCKPTDEALSRLRDSDEEAMDYFIFLQWLADAQLAACKRKAQQRGLTVGLYIDLAVGVRADSFDAWNDQTFLLRELEIGAPPDLLNTAGQKWGLAGFNPVEMVARACEPLRELLRAAMRHAGAIRLDHVLGLNRLYLIVQGTGADEGVYVGLPFEPLLATIAQESVRHRCIVIGEDLGTVPEGFRDILSAYGVWSYHVMMFERDERRFHPPEAYREKALVTFGTHDLPTFAGWLSGHDLRLKRGLGLDPGENDDQRDEARTLMRTAAGRDDAIDFASVTRFLAATPSRLLVIPMEDALGIEDQVNIPGTIDQHPNWRRKLPVALESLARDPHLRDLAAIAAEAGRSGD